MCGSPRSARAIRSRSASPMPSTVVAPHAAAAASRLDTGADARTPRAGALRRAVLARGLGLLGLLLSLCQRAPSASAIPPCCVLKSGMSHLQHTRISARTSTRRVGRNVSGRSDRELFARRRLGRLLRRRLRASHLHRRLLSDSQVLGRALGDGGHGRYLCTRRRRSVL
jgi:hypothetical protein